MSLLITNGRVITASDDYVADVYCENGAITAIGTNLPSHRFQADRTIDASGTLRHARRHRRPHPPRHAVRRDDLRPTISRPARSPPPSAGPRRSSTSPSSTAARRCATRSTTGWRKASGKAVIDYAFHMIVTELPDAGLGDMDTMVRDEGITSFKLFMAYPGVFMVDDATIFRALRQTGENGGLVCMHAENGGVIDLLVQEALRKGQKAPKYHALTRPPRAEGEATGRAIALAEMAGVPIYIVHLSSRRRARRRCARRATWGCPPTPRPARSICSSPTTTTRSPASTARST